MALVFAATIANTWFVKSRGLVIGTIAAVISATIRKDTAAKEPAPVPT